MSSVYWSAFTIVKRRQIFLISNQGEFKAGWLHFSIRVGGKDDTEVFRNPEGYWSCLNKQCSLYRGGRGQCKHILAGKMKLKEIEENTGWEI